LPLDPNFNNSNNLEVKEGIIINPSTEKGRIINMYVDGQKVLSTTGIVENGTYSIFINNKKYKTININENDPYKATYVYWGRKVIKIEIDGPADSNVYFATSDEGRFLNLLLDNT